MSEKWPHRIVCLIIALSLVFSIVSPVYAQEPQPLQDLDTYIEQAMADWEVPGLAIAVVKDDNVVRAKGYGLREVGKYELVDEHTVFAVGSTTKAFTAALVGMLVDEGKLAWDDRVIEHLPGFLMYDSWITRVVTIRDLLAHRTSLPSCDGLWYIFGYDRDELVRRVRYLEPLVGFRSTFMYQNVMYVVIGQLLDAVTGESWDELVAERIFDPLEMNETNTSVTDLATLKNIATPHINIDNELQTMPWRNVDMVAPAGAINSNVTDMAQWLRLQLGDGTYEGQQLLSPISIQTMHTPQMIQSIGDDPVTQLILANTSFLDYALGWYTYDYLGHKVVEHNGSIDGMYALVSMMPEENVGLVILTNINSTHLPFALRSRIFDAYLGLPERDWSAEMLEAVNALKKQVEALKAEYEPKPIGGTKPSLPLSEYTGTYANDLYGEIKILENNGNLVAELGPYAVRENLDHWDFDIFQMTFSSPLLPDLPVTFIIDVTGGVSKLEIPELGTFERLPETDEL